MSRQSIHLASRPAGLPDASTWELRTSETPVPGDGEVLVDVSHISLDPAMRGWINEGRSYIEPVGVGDVMRAGGVGTVAASHDPAFKVGDAVYGTLGVQTQGVYRARISAKLMQAWPRCRAISAVSACPA
jgi:NADPH-dependent curcumin reductase